MNTCLAIALAIQMDNTSLLRYLGIGRVSSHPCENFFGYMRVDSHYKEYIEDNMISIIDAVIMKRLLYTIKAEIPIPTRINISGAKITDEMRGLDDLFFFPGKTCALMFKLMNGDDIPPEQIHFLETELNLLSKRRKEFAHLISDPHQNPTSGGLCINRYRMAYKLSTMPIVGGIGNDLRCSFDFYTKNQKPNKRNRIDSRLRQDSRLAQITIQLLKEIRAKREAEISFSESASSIEDITVSEEEDKDNIYLDDMSQSLKECRIMETTRSDINGVDLECYIPQDEQVINASQPDKNSEEEEEEEALPIPVQVVQPIIYDQEQTIEVNMPPVNDEPSPTINLEINESFQKVTAFEQEHFPDVVRMESPGEPTVNDQEQDAGENVCEPSPQQFSQSLGKRNAIAALNISNETSQEIQNLLTEFSDHQVPEMQLYLPVEPDLDSFRGEFDIPDNDVLRCKFTILSGFTPPPKADFEWDDPNPLEELENVILERSMAISNTISSYL